jgi:molybdopterin-guanine dinucleotide biosynthesis protein A
VPVPAVTGFVVAGGMSQRMGRDKALLPWGETTLLDHALARLREVTDDVRILCGRERRYEDRGVPVVTDAEPESGSLIGVFSGLLVLERPLGLFLAVDLPQVPVGLLHHLASLAADADVVVPAGVLGPEPLCAVYARECLDPVRLAISRRDFKMTSFWEQVRIRAVVPTELRAFGDPDRLFLNLNSPEDYDRAGAARERG